MRISFDAATGGQIASAICRAEWVAGLPEIDAQIRFLAERCKAIGYQAEFAAGAIRDLIAAIPRTPP